MMWRLGAAVCPAVPAQRRRQILPGFGNRSFKDARICLELLGVQRLGMTMIDVLRRGAGVVLAVAGLAMSGGASAGDAGQTVFERNCRACHSIVRMQNRVGPSLFGVIDRPTASISSFEYSQALRSFSSVWSEAILDAFLGDPQAMVPGTSMRFPGLKDPAERAALIAYLKGL